MITAKGTVFSIEPEDVEVPAIIDGEETTTTVRGTGVQIVAKTGNTLKISTKMHIDMVRAKIAVGDNIVVTLAKE